MEGTGERTHLLNKRKIEPDPYKKYNSFVKKSNVPLASGLRAINWLFCATFVLNGISPLRNSEKAGIIPPAAHKRLQEKRWGIV